MVSTTVQLLLPVLTANICDGVMRYLLDKDTNKTDVIQIGSYFSSIGIGLCIVLVAINQILDIFHALAPLTAYIILFIVATQLNQFSMQVARGLESVADLAIAGVISTAVMVCCNLLFLLVLELRLPGFFLAYSLGQFCSAFYLILKLRIYKYLYLGRPRDQRLKKEILVYSFPLVMNMLGWWANSVSDRYVVTLLCGLSANGIYSVSYKIPTILNTLQGIFVQSWQISAVKEYGTRDSKKFFGNVFSIINILMSVSCMVLILMCKVLGHILYAKDFFKAWEYVPFLLVSGLINSASGIVGSILSAKKNSKAMGFSAFYGSITNVVLNFGLIFIIGVQGAAIATAISSLVIFLLRWKSVRDEIKLCKPIILCLTWAIIAFQAGLMIYSGVYWLQIVLIVIVLIINREYEQIIIRKIKEALINK